MPRFFRSLSALGLCLSLAAPGLAQDGPITEMRTPAGLRLIHLPIAGDQQEVLSFYWRDRSVQHDLARAGLLALAPMLITMGGSKTLDGGALSEDLKDLDAGFALFRSPDATSGRLTAPPDVISEVVAKTAPLLSAPRLPPRQLERQKRNLINNLNGSRQKAETIASLALTRYLVGDAPQGAWLFLEPESRITTVSTDDVANWQKSALARDNLTIVAAGPLPRDNVVTLADALFGALPATATMQPPQPFNAEPKVTTIIIERPVEQTILMLGGLTAWNNSDQALARAIALTVLGGDPSSRLFVAVRDRLGAAYGASAGVADISDKIFRFSMQASVSHDKRSEALAAMRAAYQDFRARGVSDSEIAPIKERFLTRRNDGLSKASTAADMVLQALEAGLTLDAVNNYQARLDAVTVAGLNADIARLLPEQLVTIIVTPSAQGLTADCVVKDQSDIPSCR